MKHYWTLNVPIFYILITVNATLSLQDQKEDGLIQNSTNSAYAEELFVDDCSKLEGLKNSSVIKIIATSEVIHSCQETVTRILNSNIGTLIIVGVEPSIALVCSKLDAHSKLFYNKYYSKEMPQSVEDLRNLTNNFVALDVKVYTTSHLIKNKLLNLILNSKYDEAIDVSKYLFNMRSGAEKKILINVVNRVIEENLGYEIMNFAFKFHQNDKIIVEQCFPAAFKKILTGQEVKIVNKLENGTLRLSPEKDGHRDRWTYIDCNNSIVEINDDFWKFIPNWDRTNNNVVFYIENTYYGMKLKLDSTTTGYYTKQRMAWGDEREADPLGRYAWRLVPVAFNTQGELLFCFNDVVYNFSLFHNTCSLSKEDVIGINRSCNSEMSWVIQ